MLLRDIRYGWRSLLKNRTVTAAAVACLALGIGVNTSIFSVVDVVMLKPYPYFDADRLVLVYYENKRIGVEQSAVSYPNYRDLRDQATTLQALGAFGDRSMVVADDRIEPVRVIGAAVTWNLFGILGTPPRLGRGFGPDDDRPGAPPVALIGYDIWRNRYESDAAIVGRSIEIDGRPHTIIGVMPPRFAFPEVARIWVPLAPGADTTARDDRSNQLLGRLKPGVSIEQATSDVGGIAARLASAYPAANRDWTAVAGSIREWLDIGDDGRLMVSLLMGATMLVLVIACSNVANLLLARVAMRHREISIRSAIGAGRLRIIRQLLTEAVMVALVSLPLAFLVAWAGLRLLDWTIPPDSVPDQWRWSLDARALMYMATVAMVTGILFGSAPAIQATGASLVDSIREGGHGSAGERRAWLRNGLVVVQVALAVILLIGSSLFVRSFVNLQRTTVGFDTAPLMTLRVSLGGDRYATPDARIRRVEDIVGRIEHLPGVEAAFASAFVPMSGGAGGGQAIVGGKQTQVGQEPWIELVAATPHLRQTLRVALQHGRDFTDAEGTARTPVALVNWAMAKRLWADGDAVGRTFRLRGGDTPEWFTVIGVVADFRHYQSNEATAQPAAYVPYPFQTALNTGLTIRVAGDPASIMGAVREQVRLSDPRVPIFQVMTMEERRQRSFWEFRAVGVMFSLFGVIALVLASVGVYGVLAYSVSRRTQEIGVRVALGAARADVLRLILRQGLTLGAIGIVLGAVAAAVLTPVMRSVLYNGAPSDPLSFLLSAAFLLGVAVVASYVPARRAMTVDAISAIRTE